jgi:hypothetical protein
MLVAYWPFTRFPALAIEKSSKLINTKVAAPNPAKIKINKYFIPNISFYL